MFQCVFSDLKSIEEEEALQRASELEALLSSANIQLLDATTRNQTLQGQLLDAREQIERMGELQADVGQPDFSDLDKRHRETLKAKLANDKKHLEYRARVDAEKAETKTKLKALQTQIDELIEEKAEATGKMTKMANKMQRLEKELCAASLQISHHETGANNAALKDLHTTLEFERQQHAEKLQRVVKEKDERFARVLAERNQRVKDLEGMASGVAKDKKQLSALKEEIAGLKASLKLSRTTLKRSETRRGELEIQLSRQGQLVAEMLADRSRQVFLIELIKQIN